MAAVVIYPATMQVYGKPKGLETLNSLMPTDADCNNFAITVAFSI
jgi:hypothetical protein